MTNYYKLGDVMRSLRLIGVSKKWVYRHVYSLSEGVRTKYADGSGPMMLELHHIDELMNILVAQGRHVTETDKELIRGTQPTLLPEDTPPRVNKTADLVSYQHRHNLKKLQEAREVRATLLSIAGETCDRCGCELVGTGRKAHFHHVDPATKSFALSGRHLSAIPFDIIMKEFEKCILLCAHCHMKTHMEMRKEAKNESVTVE